jgi:putative PIN family toxin of toxin-antitoxin system
MEFFNYVSSEHNLMVCSYSIEEAFYVVSRKFPNRMFQWYSFMPSVKHIYFITPTHDYITYMLGDFSVRDEKDNPILASAILSNADVLITGDRDFEDLELDRPEILTIREFMDKYYTEDRSEHTRV